MVRRAAPRAPRAGRYPIDGGELELLQDADISSRWLLSVNGTPQSFVDLDDPAHLEFDYVRQVSAGITGAYGTEVPLRVVHLGAGAASLARHLDATRPGSRQVLVDIDAALVQVVREQLGLPPAPAVRVRVGDARAVAGRLSAGLADVVVCDVFAGASTPAHLTSVEFFRACRRLLRPGGLLLANVADGPPQPGLAFARAETATIAACFTSVAVIGAPGVLAGRRFGNLIVAASDGPLEAAELRRCLSSEPLPVRVLEPAETHRFAGGRAPIHDPAATDSPPIPP